MKVLGSALARVAGLLLPVVALLLVSSAGAQDRAAQYFEANCASCHSIGGGFLAGPDLKDVTRRADRKWLIDFMRDPDDKIAKKDQYALKLQAEAQGMTMPHFLDLDVALGEELLQYIEAQSGAAPGPEPDTAGAPTANTTARGQALFAGAQRLQRGGAACFGCHDVAAGSALGGGRLGPDLTAVFQRLGRRKGLGAWLASPPTPLMAAMYRDKPLAPDEIQALVAYFEGTATSPAGASAGRTRFVLAGIGLFAMGMVFSGATWMRRRRSARELLSGRGER